MHTSLDLNYFVGIIGLYIYLERIIMSEYIIMNFKMGLLTAPLQITTNGKLKTALAKGAAYESFPWSAFSGRNHSLGRALV